MPKGCTGGGPQDPYGWTYWKDQDGRRVLQRFYWPTLYKDVTDHCRSCSECQRVAPRSSIRAPLVPLPVMETPFERIAIDIVGPLPKSRVGNRFVLVICDYTTRYPDAVPLRSCDTEHVVEALVNFFAQVGVPREILSDQGTNFTSQLMKEIQNLLHVRAMKTTPYHAQTDGLVVHFNKTLKSMLHKYAAESSWTRTGTSCCSTCYLHTEKSLRCRQVLPHLSFCMAIQHMAHWTC